MARLRVATYNVHRCFGRGGRESAADVLASCREMDADVLALQELDAPHTDDDTSAAHHARDFAEALGMHLLFCRTLARGTTSYGHALLSRHPLTLVQVATLPAAKPGTEPRGALWATLDGPVCCQVISTHLGIHARDRRVQVRELERWLSDPRMVGPRVLCGDLNAIAGGRSHRALTRTLRDAHRAAPGPTRATFPSAWPLVRIDHVLVSPELRIVGAGVLQGDRARRASDHRPLWVDLELPG